MRKLLLIPILLVLSISAADAKRKHVRIVKASPPYATTQPVTVPLVAVPPLAVAVDLALRTSCDPQVLAYGSGPGWSSKDAIVGNFLLPAIYTRCGYPVPKWLQPAMPKKA